MPSPRLSLALPLLLTAVASPASPVLAQETPPLARAFDATIDGAFDLRARIPNTGGVSSGLHASYFRIQAGENAPQALRFNVFGLDQYGHYRWQQATVEKEWGGSDGSRLPDRVQAGILRLPFGIYDFRETYASGLIDYPLPRGDYAFNGVDWGVPGVQWSGGNSSVQADVAGFSGQGVGVWGNVQHAEGGIGHLQFFLPPNVILGFSNWQGRLAPFEGQTARQSQPVHFAGTDLRYTLSHLVVRGEFVAGALPYARHTRGGYLDAYYRLPGWEKITLVGRIEALRPGNQRRESRQLTLGARWTVTPSWMLAANWRRNNLAQAYSFTWTEPAERRGDVLLQALYTFSLSPTRR